MLDHIGIPVSDYEKSKAFYSKILKALGYELVFEVSHDKAGSNRHAGFGAKNKPQFWISTGKPLKGGPAHIAFVAKNRDAVRAFYDAAMKSGGRDNGAPGLRPHYHENYFGAFVLDPDGQNIEAVCHLAE